MLLSLPALHAGLPQGICDIRPAVICNNIGIKLASLSCREVSVQGPWLIQQARENRSLPALGKENNGVCLQSVQLIQTAFLKQQGKGPSEQMGREHFPTCTERCSLGRGKRPGCTGEGPGDAAGPGEGSEQRGRAVGAQGLPPALGMANPEQLMLLEPSWAAARAGCRGHQLLPAPHRGRDGASPPAQPWRARVSLSCRLQRGHTKELAWLCSTRQG